MRAQPLGDPPPFEVTGSSATWSGTLRDRESGREEAARIELECGASPLRNLQYGMYLYAPDD